MKTIISLTSRAALRVMLAATLSIAAVPNAYSEGAGADASYSAADALRDARRVVNQAQRACVLQKMEEKNPELAALIKRNRERFPAGSVQECNAQVEFKREEVRAKLNKCLRDMAANQGSETPLADCRASTGVTDLVAERKACFEEKGVNPQNDEDRRALRQNRLAIQNLRIEAQEECNVNTAQTQLNKINTQRRNRLIREAKERHLASEGS